MADSIEVTVERWTRLPPVWDMPEEHLHIIPHIHNLRVALYRLLYKTARDHSQEGAQRRTGCRSV